MTAIDSSARPTKAPEPVTAEEIAAVLRYDVTLPGPRWQREMATDGEQMPDGSGGIGDDYPTRHIETAPCAESDGETEAVIDWCHTEEIADFVVLMRTLGPKMVRALQALAEELATARDHARHASEQTNILEDAAYVNGKAAGRQEAIDWLKKRAAAIESEIDGDCDGQDADRFCNEASVIRQAANDFAAKRDP